MSEHGPERLDLAVLDCTGTSGAIWSLPHAGDLDVNVVVLQAGDAIGDHVNDDVDVLVIGIAGRGTVTVGGAQLVLDGTAIVHIPKGAVRSVAAGRSGRVVYLTVHHARPPLDIRRR